MNRRREYNGLRQPQPWHNPRAIAKQARGNALTFHQIVILRRLRAGETQASIARALDYASGVVNKHLRTAMEFHPECTTYEELWNLPEVRAQLDGE